MYTSSHEIIITMRFDRVDKVYIFSDIYGSDFKIIQTLCV